MQEEIALDRKSYVMGNVAIARGAVAAGCRAFFGYPITPSNEIMESMARLLPPLNGAFMQMEDEMASMAAAIGASWAGVKAMTATSGPGFSLMQENIGLATMLEVPCVIVNAQRVGPSTGIPTLSAQQDLMQSIWGRHGDQYLIVMSPTTLQEMYDLAIEVFNLSEVYRTPVILLTDGTLARMYGEVMERRNPEVIDRKPLDITLRANPLQTGESGVPGFPPLASGYRVHFTGLTHNQHSYPTANKELAKEELLRTRDKILGNRQLIEKYEARGLEDCEVLYVAYGSSAMPVRWAYKVARRKGLKVGYFVPKSLWPFPEDEFLKAAQSPKKIVITEISIGQLIYLIREMLGKDSRLTQIFEMGDLVDPRILVKEAEA